MKNLRTLRWLGTMILAMASLGWAHDHDHAHGTPAKKEVKNKSVTLTGEVVDLTCYLSHGGKGPDHQACAIDCAQKGLPVGLLEDKTDKVYLVATNDHKAANAMLVPYMGEKVKLTGQVREGKGVTLLLMSKVEKTGK